VVNPVARVCGIALQCNDERVRMNTVLHSRITHPVAPHQDSFVLAASRLAAQRPLRNKRLLQVSEHIDGGRLELARTELEKHLARQPADADALHLLARTALRTGRRAEAFEHLARCLRVAPDFAAARFNRSSSETPEGLFNLSSSAVFSASTAACLRMYSEAFAASASAIFLVQSSAEGRSSSTFTFMAALQGHCVSCIK